MLFIFQELYDSRGDFFRADFVLTCDIAVPPILKPNVCPWCRVTPENVFGVVVDGVEYQTQLRYEENDIGLFCTCDQFAKSKACKHLWATVLTADLEGYINPAIRPGRLDAVCFQRSGDSGSCRRSAARLRPG